eukprot:2797659-Prymnesium_polylepis.1
MSVVNPNAAATAPLPTLPGATRGASCMDNCGQCCSWSTNAPAASGGCVSGSIWASVSSPPPWRSVQKSTLCGRSPVARKKSNLFSMITVAHWVR